MQGVSASGEAGAVLAHIALTDVHCRRDSDTSTMQGQGYLLDSKSWNATCVLQYLGTKLFFIAASTRLASKDLLVEAGRGGTCAKRTSSFTAFTYSSANSQP